jgi:dihydrofolate reductase
MGVSLDGFIAGRDGDIGWSAPDQERHRFHNEEVRALAAHLCGRRLYEVMRFWDTAPEDSLGDVEREFQGIWRQLPKIVFSRTLSEVQGNARLATAGLAAELAGVPEEPGKDIAVGGAGLAAGAIALGLVDEFRLFVSPVMLGGGTPYFPAGIERTQLELLETRTLGDRVTYLRYARA